MKTVDNLWYENGRTIFGIIEELRKGIARNSMCCMWSKKDKILISYKKDTISIMGESLALSWPKDGFSVGGELKGNDGRKLIPDGVQVRIKTPGKDVLQYVCCGRLEYNRNKVSSEFLSTKKMLYNLFTLRIDPISYSGTVLRFPSGEDGETIFHEYESVLASWVVERKKTPDGIKTRIADWVNL